MATLSTDAIQPVQRAGGGQSLETYGSNSQELMPYISSGLMHVQRPDAKISYNKLSRPQRIRTCMLSGLWSKVPSPQMQVQEGPAAQARCYHGPRGRARLDRPGFRGEIWRASFYQEPPPLQRQHAPVQLAEQDVAAASTSHPSEERPCPREPCQLLSGKLVQIK